MTRSWLVYVLLLPAFSAAAAQTGTANAAIAGPRFAQDYNWSSKPGVDLNAPGPKTVTLSSCPPGVEGNEPEYWVYISGTGKAEAVRITGGTCSGNGSEGTLLFTTTNSHPQGYAIGSASSGLQEASIASRVAPTNPTGPRQAGKVVVFPGDLDAYAPVSIRATNQTVDFSGSVINCYVDDSCLVVGDRRNSLNTLDVTLINPRGRPMVSNGTKPFVEVNAQKTRIFNVATRRTDSRGGTFGTYVQVDDDQAFLLDGLDTGIGGGLRCDATFCGSFVMAPGPFNRWSAVGWLKNMNISANCAGNGVDWMSGNTVHIDDSVIQGYNQFAVRGGSKRGGYGGTSLGNIYMEVGNCSNPKGNVGIAGVIQEGTSLGGSGVGSFPRYANTGKVQVNYYIVAKHAAYGNSVPLLAGSAMTNGSGAIKVTTNDIPGAAGFDLLRVTNSGAFVGPSGTGNFLVAGNVSRETACINDVCTFTDRNTEPVSYTVATPSYFPILPMWPGNAVLSASRDTNDPWTTAVARIGGFKGGVVSVAGSRRVSVIADVCGASSNWSPLWASCSNTTDPPSGNFAQHALLMTTKPNLDAGQQLNLKGRMNFGTLGSGPGHIITLSDSNFEKTIGQSNGRPTNDVNDAYIGYDSTYASGSKATGISFGAPGSLSNYIGNAGDGKNWKERLTAKEKILAVPLVVKSGNTFTLGAGSALSQMKIYTTKSPKTTVPGQSCLDVDGTVSGLSTADQITGVTPPSPLGNVSLNAYPKAEDTITLHFCNPSASGVSVPPGVYSFLAVH